MTTPTPKNWSTLRSKSKIKNKTGQLVIIFGTLQVLHDKTHLDCVVAGLKLFGKTTIIKIFGD